jgi:nitrite reductase/ring-hydroxylating ferredoxin subunit
MNVKEVRPEVAIALVGILVGAWFGYVLAHRTAQTHAIKNDCAHYDGKTGEFKWGIQ